MEGGWGKRGGGGRWGVGRERRRKWAEGEALEGEKGRREERRLNGEKLKTI